MFQEIHSPNTSETTVAQVLEHDSVSGTHISKGFGFHKGTRCGAMATLLPMPEVGVKLDVLRLSLVMPWGD